MGFQRQLLEMDWQAQMFRKTVPDDRSCCNMETLFAEQCYFSYGFSVSISVVTCLSFSYSFIVILHKICINV